MAAKTTWLYFAVGLVALTLAGTAALAMVDSDRSGTAIYGDASDAAIYFGTYVADAEQADAVVAFNNINPSDIETITVLKDAGATALYGCPDNIILLVEDAKAVSNLGPRALGLIYAAAAAETGMYGPLWIIDGVPLAASVGIIGGADGPTAIYTFIPPIIMLDEAIGIDLYVPGWQHAFIA